MLKQPNQIHLNMLNFIDSPPPPSMITIKENKIGKPIKLHRKKSTP